MLSIGDLFLIGFPLLAAACIIAAIRRVRPCTLCFWAFVSSYILVVLGLTLFPIPYQEAGCLLPVPHNLIPFHTIASTLQAGLTPTALVQIGGNILLSVPYGVILDLTGFSRKKGLVFLLALLFPLVIEFLQLGIGIILGAAYRSFDIDDILLNLLGAYWGIFFSKCLFRKYRDRLARKLFPKK